MGVSPLNGFSPVAISNSRTPREKTSERESTGFASASPGSGDPLPDRLRPLLEQCLPSYDALAPYRLRPEAP